MSQNPYECTGKEDVEVRIPALPDNLPFDGELMGFEAGENKNATPFIDANVRVVNGDYEGKEITERIWVGATVKAGKERSAWESVGRPTLYTIAGYALGCKSAKEIKNSPKVREFFIGCKSPKDYAERLNKGVVGVRIGCIARNEKSELSGGGSFIKNGVRDWTPPSA